MPQLPWPEPELPTYRRAAVGEWSLARTKAMKYTVGYFLPVRNQPAGWVMRHQGKNIWMSLTRMELESQMPHLAAARGHTVVAGLGMGFALYNIAKKPEVERVTVLERDPDIVALLDAAAGWRGWPGHEKVELVMGDALAYVPSAPVDFLYADIWPHVADKRALPDTVAMQANVRAREVGYWAQEWDYAAFLADTGAMRGRASYRRFAREAGLPLIERDSLRYPSLAVAAVALQLAGGEKEPDRKDRMMERWADIVTETDPLALVLDWAIEELT